MRPRFPISSALLAMLLSLAALAPSTARAQTTEIVELRDGSFVRGTIVERTEGSHLVVQTVTGELRRVPLADVTYAGDVAGRRRSADGGPLGLGSPTVAPNAVPPAPSAPPAPRPSAGERRAPSAIEPRIFDAEERGSERPWLTVETTSSGIITLHAMTQSATAEIPGDMRLGGGSIRIDAFQPLCVAPCNLRLTPGAYVFGVSEGEGSARRAGAPRQIDQDALLHVDFDNRGGLRALGWTTFVLGILGGLAIAVAPIIDGGNDFAMSMGFGAGTFALGTLIALPMILLNDAVSVQVELL